MTTTFCQKTSPHSRARGRLAAVFAGALLLCMPGSPVRLAAQRQGRTAAVQKYLLEAKAYAAQGALDAAKKSYRQALNADRDNLDAYLGLGELAIQQKKWKEANGQFKQILQRQPDNLLAHYYRGMCYRETGKFKPVILNALLDYRRSEKHFTFVFERDSSFRDVLYQFALLMRYRDKYDRALQLAHRQLALRPELLEPQLGLLRIYHHFIIRNSLKKVQKKLGALPWVHARFYFGEKLRREQRFAAADSIFSQVLAAPGALPRQAIHLARAKSLYQQNRPEAAERAYWQAVDGIASHLDAAVIFENLKYILDAGELPAYRALETPAQKVAFFHAFWARRDPTPAAAVNVRLAEHFRRFVYAEKYYEYIGFRSWANSPDKSRYLPFPPAYELNDQFNDKGLIYLRHGDPDDRAVTLGQSVPSNESWVYWRRENSPELVFHFLYDQTVSGNLWRLTPTITNPALLADRVDWDPIYYRMARAQTAGERFVLEDEMAEISKKAVATGLTTDRHSWHEKMAPLEVPFSFATFRGSAGQSVLELYFGVPAAALQKAMAAGTPPLKLETGFAVHDRNWRPVQQARNQITVPAAAAAAGFADLYRLTLAPAAYFAALHVKPLGTNLLGGYAGIEVPVDAYDGGTLALSDIEFATAIRKSAAENKFTKHGLEVVPNPARRYRRNRLVHIYFEIYGLSLDENRRTAFTIEYTVREAGKKRRKFLGIFGGRKKAEISVQMDRAGGSEFSAEYLAIDVGKFGKGDVELEIGITDRVQHAVARKTAQFTLF